MTKEDVNENSGQLDRIIAKTLSLDLFPPVKDDILFIAKCLKKKPKTIKVDSEDGKRIIDLLTRYNGGVYIDWKTVEAARRHALDTLIDLYNFEVGLYFEHAEKYKDFRKNHPTIEVEFDIFKYKGRVTITRYFKAV